MIGRRFTLVVLLVLMGGLGMTGCGRSDLAQRDHIHQTELKDIRLGDGVPLAFSVSIRWRIEDTRSFTHQFADPAGYAKLVLDAKSREVAGKVANAYPSVAAVFRPEREKFVQEMKEALSAKLAEPGIRIKEVILSEMLFPKSFTDALEVTATKDLELQRVREKSAIDLEQAKAAQAHAQAEGQVRVERARVEGKVAEISAQTEDKRRLSEVARAETEARVLDRRTKAEVDRQRLLTRHEVERRQELNRVDIDKQRQLDQVAIVREKGLALLTAENPSYAAYLVNRELASKVQIAVLPLGTESSVLGNMLQSTLAGGNAQRPKR